jgi:hypothetical protein
MIVVQRETLPRDLRSYGEDELADRVLIIEDEELKRIWARADHCVYSDEYALPSGASMMIAKAVALAAVEVLEGTPREHRWKQQKLKGIYPGY